MQTDDQPDLPTSHDPALRQRLLADIRETKRALALARQPDEYYAVSCRNLDSALDSRPSGGSWARNITIRRAARRPATR
jgi:hypothetical protein